MSDKFITEVLRGGIPGCDLWSLNGLNLDVDTTEEDIIMAGGTQNWMALTGDTIQFVSDSAADDGNPVGTGACTIDAWFLDTSFNIIKETITLNGLTAVDTTSAVLIRLLDYKVTRTGTGGATAGNITIRKKTGPVTASVCNAGYNNKMDATFTVPAGRAAMVMAWSCEGHWGTAAAENVELQPRLYSRAYHATNTVPWVISSIKSSHPVPLIFNEKTDLRITSAVGEDNIIVAAHMDIVTIPLLAVKAFR